MGKEPKPLVSIIIPTFNRDSLISETLDSVLKQNYSRWECIIVDDGSDDNTINKVNEYLNIDNRFILIIRDREPKGANTCRNIGLKKSIGEYIIFLDSDDLLSHNCLAKRINIFRQRQYESKDFLVFQTLGFKNKPGDYNLLWNVISSKEKSLERFLKGDTPWATLSVIWKRNSICKLKGWNENVKCWQDWELHVRALLENLEYEVILNSGYDSFFRCDHQFDAISKNEYSYKHLLSRADTIKFIWSNYNNKLGGYEMLFMLLHFRLAAILKSNNYSEESLKIWRQYKTTIGKYKFIYFLWDIYFKKNYFFDSKSRYIVKRILDRILTKLTGIHFWDNKNTFKKVLIDA